MSAIPWSGRNAVPAPLVEREAEGEVIHIVGDLDVVSAPVVDAAVAEAHTAGRFLVLDLSATSFCDSSGIRSLYRAHRRVTEAGSAFAIRNPSRQVRRVLAACDPDETMPIEQVDVHPS